MNSLFNFRRLLTCCPLIAIVLLWHINAMAQTPIPITGPTDVCIGSVHNYSVAPTSGINYSWSTSAQGNIAGTNLGASTNVSWTTSGSAQVVVEGRDAGNNLMEIGTAYVNVRALPNPNIEWDTRVGCQIVDTPKKQQEAVRPGEGIDDGPCIRVCENSTVKYWITNPTGGPVTWEVSANGTIITTSASSCEVVWGSPGFGSITVTEAYPAPLADCIGTTQICIEIIASPIAAFTAVGYNMDDELNACVNQEIFFIDQSDAGSGTPIVSWYWDFGDGNFSSAANPSHTYTTPGNYTVTLVVTNDCNCKSTYSRKIKVHPNDKPIVIACPSVVCEGASATYRITGGNLAQIQECLDAASAYWEVIGGTIVNPPGGMNVEVVWDNVGPDGFGYLIFHPGNDCALCPAPTVVKVPVILTNGTIDGPLFVCPNQRQYRYTLPQWPATLFNWSIVSGTGATLAPTDQTNEIMLITANPGLVQIKAQYNNTLLGCAGTAIIDVMVTQPVTLNGPAQACAGAMANYNLPAGYTGDWTVSGPGGFTYAATNTNNISFNFGNAGNYVINTTGNFCLEEPFNVTVQSIPATPLAIDGNDSICTGIPYQFTASPAIPGTIFEWSVTGGVLSGQSGNEVTATFSGAGPYTIQVVRKHIQSPNCASSPLTKVLYKTVINPIISGAAAVCPNTTHSYSSSFIEGETYEWSIAASAAGSVAAGNGTPNVAILWNHATTTITTNVELRMRKCDSVYVVIFPVTINPIPNLTLSAPDSICNGSLLTINTTGAGANTVNWTYNGGGTYVGTNFSDIIDADLTANSIYTFTATITNPNGCPGSVSESVQVVIKPKPAVSISPSGGISVCPPNPINVGLTATLQGGYMPTNKLEWFMGNTSLTSCLAPITCFTYNASSYGSFKVVATGTNGCTDTSNVFNIINDCPTVCTLVPDPTVSANTIANDNCGTFTVSGNYTGTPLASGWLFDPTYLDQISIVGNDITIEAERAGAYNITFWAAYLDVNGDTCIKTAVNPVLVPLISDIRFSAVCNGLGTGYDLTAHDFSNMYPGTIINNYTYYLTGSATATVGPITAASHTFAGLPQGTYNLQIKVNYTYGGGTYDCYSEVLNALMPQLPQAAFNVVNLNPACVDYPVEFLNTSTPTTLDYMWDFDEGGAQSTVAQPHKTYLVPGFKTVSLTVTNQYGCSNMATQNIAIVSNTLGGNMVAGPSQIVCSGTPISLAVNVGSSSFPDSYSWMNDTINFLNTAYQPVTVNQSGYYWAVLHNAVGCVRYTDPISVTVIAVPDVMIVGDQFYCEDEDVVLDGYAGPNMTYQWYESSLGLLAGYTNPTLTYPALPAGNYQFILEIAYTHPTSGTVCMKKSNPYPVTVSVPPAPPTISMAMLDCNKYLIQLDATHPDPGNFTWSNGMAGTPIQVTEGGPYKVWFDNGKGCLSNASVEVPRNPEDYLWMFPTGCYTFCYQQLPKRLYGPIVPFVYWEWQHNGPNSQAGSGFVQPYDITDGGVYNLLLKNQFCEKTSKELDVTAVDCKDCYLRPNSEIYCKSNDVGDCIYQMNLSTYNPYPYNMNVNLTSTMATFAPSSVTLAPGSNYFIVQVIPGVGYTPGPHQITLTGSYFNQNTQQMEYCISNFQGYFPDNCCDQLRPAGTTDRGLSKTNLQLAPNPARESVQVHYQFDENTKTKQVELYDLTGRKLKTVNVSNNRGTMDWNLQEFTNGMYIILMRQDGKVIHQNKLSLTK